MLELDHIFVCISNELDIINIYSEFGLNFSARRIHPGQGTANRCAFFNNAYLELLLRDNDQELQSQPVKPVSLWERLKWKHTGANPFGVAFRFVKNTNQDLPVPTWFYHAPFLPDGASIPIITPPNSIQEPLIFLSPVVKAPFDRSSTEHRGSKRTVTQVKITTPSAQNISPGVKWFCEKNLIYITEGVEYHLELEWDSGKEKKILDFKPKLPMSIRG
jgi:Glyoxalase-like domain